MSGVGWMGEVIFVLNPTTVKVDFRLCWGTGGDLTIFHEINSISYFANFVERKFYTAFPLVIKIEM